MALDEAIQSLADRLGEPVVLYDADLSVVTFSVHGETTDPVRRSIILSRRASVRAANMMRRSARRAGQPALIPADSETGVIARVIYPVHRKGRLLGFVAYLLEDPHASLASSHRRALAAAETELAELLFIRCLQEQPGRHQLPETMRMLISDVAPDREAAARILLDEGLVCHAPQYRAVLLSISPQPARRGSPHGHLLLESCVALAARSARLRAAGTTLGRQRGVLVLPGAADFTCLALLLGNESGGQVRAGVGAPRSALSDFAGSYHEAEIAARAAWADREAYGAVASWDDLGLDRVLLQMPLDSLTVDDLPTTVQPLLSAASGPDLAATLERYLDTGCDAQATARLLHIHRSTLYYRLGLIRKITGAELADGRLRRELHTALRIATLAGLRPAKRAGQYGPAERAFGSGRVTSPAHEHELGPRQAG